MKIFNLVAENYESQLGIIIIVTKRACKTSRKDSSVGIG